jgi:hypothetical protein
MESVYRPRPLWIDKDTGGDVSSSRGSYATLSAAPSRKKIKPHGFALTALLSNVSPPTNSIWAHLKRMGSSALPIGGAAVSAQNE